MTPIDPSVEFALSSSRTGIWKWSLDDDRFDLSKTLRNDILGLTLAPNFLYSDFLARIHSDDKIRFVTMIDDQARNGARFEITHRVHGAKGVIKWVTTCGQKDPNANIISGTCQDVSHSNDDILTLKKQVRELRHIFDFAPVRIWYKDDQNRILRLNQNAADSMGLSVSDVEGADTYELFPEMAKKYHDDDLRVINSGEPALNIVEKYTPINQPAGWVSTDKVPYTDPVTNERYVLVMSHDVTAQVEAQEKLKASEARMSVVLSSVYDGYWDWHIKENYEYMSPRLWEMFGVDPKTKKHEPSEMSELMFEEDRALTLMNLEKHFETKGKHPFSQEVRYHHTDGSTVTVLCRGQVIEWGEDGSPVRMVGTHTDLTELKEARAETELLGARIKMATEISKVGVWDWPLDDSGFGWWSETCFELTGIEHNNTKDVRKRFIERIHPDDAKVFLKNLSAHIRKKTPFQMEFRLKHPDGRDRWLLISGKAKLGSDGTPKRLVGSLINVEEIKKAELRLKLYAKKLEGVNRDLDHFAYSASHDLKAPLRSIDNLAKWIAEDIGDNMPEGAREKFALLHGRVERMENLLKDILVFSRAGKNINETEDVDMNELVAEVIEWVAPPDGFTISVETDLPELNIHPTSLQQVFLNLLSNAVKHHDKTEGEITISHTETRDAHIFTIKDDGPGIAEEYQSLIFEIFRTLNPRDKREGSGIGLSIVKRMVDAMNGKIDIVSAPPKRGTIFHITVPKVYVDVSIDPVALTGS